MAMRIGGLCGTGLLIAVGTSWRCGASRSHGAGFLWRKIEVPKASSVRMKQPAGATSQQLNRKQATRACHRCLLSLMNQLDIRHSVRRHARQSRRLDGFGGLDGQDLTPPSRYTSPLVPLAPKIYTGRHSIGRICPGVGSASVQICTGVPVLSPCSSHRS